MRWHVVETAARHHGLHPPQSDETAMNAELCRGASTF
jgi:hypothetical protein